MILRRHRLDRCKEAPDDSRMLFDPLDWCKPRLPDLKISILFQSLDHISRQNLK